MIELLIIAFLFFGIYSRLEKIHTEAIKPESQKEEEKFWRDHAKSEERKKIEQMREELRNRPKVNTNWFGLEKTDGPKKYGKVF
jgi:hypothetical protein